MLYCIIDAGDPDAWEDAYTKPPISCGIRGLENNSQIPAFFHATLKINIVTANYSPYLLNAGSPQYRKLYKRLATPERMLNSGLIGNCSQFYTSYWRQFSQRWIDKP